MPGDMQSSGKVPQERDVMCLRVSSGAEVIQAETRKGRKVPPQACGAGGEAEGQGSGGWGRCDVWHREVRHNHVIRLVF